ncbi:IS66 family insertion sequence element accessory protein TnpA [Sorangium sp. So ce321]|uniref:IS66 family insertion sequence element accessory protein TnpA n=1 Tax=Sorangium sp. So ce321 TaxID=3133300 RepID=UPI003F607E4F
MATRVEWAERVERWERSGLSAEKFARREGYKPEQLYWWRWKLRAGRARSLRGAGSGGGACAGPSATATRARASGCR